MPRERALAHSIEEQHAHAVYLKSTRKIHSNPENARREIDPSYRDNRGIEDFENQFEVNPLEVAENRYRQLLKKGTIKQGEPLCVLDLACAYGVMLGELKKGLEEKGIPVELVGQNFMRYPLRNFSGVQPAFASGVKQVVSTAERLKPEWTDKFHLVFGLAFMPHVRNHVRVINEVNRVLHPNGTAYIHLGRKDWMKGLVEELERRDYISVHHRIPNFVRVHLRKMSEPLHLKLKTSTFYKGYYKSEYEEEK